MIQKWSEWKEEENEGDFVKERKLVKEIKVVERDFGGRGLAFDLETYSGEKFG